MRYTIIGGDGQAYGPVEAGQIRAWFAEHRVDTATRLQLEGDTVWVALGQRPEFADLIPPPVLPGKWGGERIRTRAEAETLLQATLARNTPVAISVCISRAWALLIANFPLVLGAAVCLYLLEVAASCVPFIGGLASKPATGSGY